MIPGDTPSQAANAQDVIVQTAFTAALFVFLFGLLCLVHYYRPFERVYFPSDVGHRRIKEASWLKWIGTIWSCTLEDVLQESGVDGALIFCCIEMAIQFFASCALLCTSVILPVHAMYKGPRNEHEPTELFTIDNIPSGSNVLFLHLAATWIITIVFYLLLYRTYTRVLAIKNRYMLLTGPSSRVILVEGIASDLTENDLTAYFASISIGRVEKVLIVCRNAKLKHALADRWRWIQRLEQLAVQLPDQAHQLLSGQPNVPVSSLMNASRSSSILPNTPHSTNVEQALLSGVPVARPPKSLWEKLFSQIRWAKMMPEIRLEHAYSRYLDADARVCALRNDFTMHAKRTSTALVIFSHPISQSITLQALVHSSMTELRVAPAPSPTAIHFDNLGISPNVSFFRSIIASVGIFFLIFFWVVPVGIIASFLSPDELLQVFPWLEILFEKSPLVATLFKSIVPTLAITIFLSLLPLLLDVLSRIKGFKGQADANLFVFTTYFYFLLFNVLLVFSIAGTLWQSLSEIIESPACIPELLARSLPKVSPFFVNLVMLHALVLLLLWVLQFGNVFVNGIIFRAYTPRDHIIASKRLTWNFYEFAPTILIFVIGMVYSLVCPVILPLVLLHACIAWFVWRYRLLYQVKVVQSCGRIWVEIVRMLHYGLMIFVLLMLGILSLKKFYWSAVGLIPLLGIVALGWMWITQMERRVLNVPLDVWRAWQGDTVDEECDAVGGECQGVYGIEKVPIERYYDNPLVYGELPQPWLPVRTTHTHSSTSQLTPEMLPAYDERDM